MPQEIVVIGKTTNNGEATEITIDNVPPMQSLLAAEAIIASHTHENTLSTTTGDATHAACSATDAAYGAETSLGTFLTGASLTNAAAKPARKALTVVTDTPDADGEIQLTDVNKVKLYLDTGLTADDILILHAVVVGEYARP